MSAAETRIHNALVQNMPAGYHFDTHMHRTVEIFICLSGVITISVLGVPHAVNAGEYLLVFPNVLHSCDIPQDGPCSILQMHFYPESLPQLAYQCSSSESCLILELALDKRKFFKGRSTPQLAACLEGVRAELANPQDGGRNMLEAYLTLLNILLSRDLYDRAPRSQLYENRHLMRATIHINEHCTEKLTVGGVAEAVGISAGYLTRLFREELNLGVSTYITYVRISKAIDFMFANPNYPLTSLALEMGFCSLQHFSKIFKDKMGVSPKKYFSIRPI